MMLNADEKDFVFHKRGNKKSLENLLTFYRKERKKGTPHVYLCGKMSFFDVDLFITEACLIPRMETEILVERALERLPETGRVLDLCTGSGAIGLAIKRARPLLEVTLADISRKALKIAKKNAHKNGLVVDIVEGDFLTPFSKGSFDAIICNPPYITIDEYKKMDSLVRDYEPRAALTDEEDGLKYYKLLAKEAFYYLKSSGILCLEIGKDQGESVRGLFRDSLWASVVVEKDYSSHDRFVFLTK